MTRLIAVFLLTIGYSSGQAVPVCSAVTEDQAKTLLGPTAKRTHDPSECQWQASGDKQLDVVRVNGTTMFEIARVGEGKKGKVTVEDGLGGPAFSAVPSAYHGGRVTIYVVKGSAILLVSLEGFPPGGAEERLPLLRDLARKLAPKL